MDVDAVIGRVGTYLDRRFDELLAPGVQLALTDRQRTLAVICRGFSNAEAGIPVEPHHMFQIGSISKGLTAMALLQDREAGRLELDAPVTAYLPWLEIPSPYPPITVHHLMSHTSGLIMGTDFTTEAMHEVWSLRELEPGFAPGDRFWYSNVGYKALGLILERITGRPWFDVVHERVMSAVGMKEAVATITHDTRPNLAPGYWGRYDDRPWHPAHGLVPAPWSESGTADGTISSTTDQLAGYVRALLNRGQGVLDEASFELMSRPMAADQDAPGDVYGYGLKWVDDRFLGHSGGTLGYVALALCEPATGFGVAICTNGIGPRIGLARFALETLAAADARSALPDVPPASDDASVADAGRFAGVYEADGRSFEVRADGDHLVLRTDRDSLLVPFDPLAPGSFVIDDADLDRYVLRFQTGANGDVERIDHGPARYVRAGVALPPGHDATPVQPELAAIVGHYRTHDPWLANVRVFVRDGGLWLQDVSHDELRYHERPLDPRPDGTFRVGEPWSPDRIRFDTVIDGRATRAVYDCAPMYRAFTP